MTIAETIAYYIEKKGWTYGQAGEAAGMDAAAVWNYANGKRNPKPQTLRRLCDALDIPDHVYYAMLDGKAIQSQD